MPAELCALDWSAPWLAPYRAHGERVAGRWAQGQSVAGALNAEEAFVAHPAGRLRFVAQSDLPEGEAYEAFIARTACVPTRDNLHDFFNGLVWQAFPALKAHLNALQAQTIGREGIGAVRGPVRDALTLFDENAAWLHADDGLANALRQHAWGVAFGTHRARWHAAGAVVFGHALLEKLVQPYKAITAHAWLLPPGCDASSHLLAVLTPAYLAAKPHTALPILGVPGWWPANENAAFYDDRAVFRPLRHRTVRA